MYQLATVLQISVACSLKIHNSIKHLYCNLCGSHGFSSDVCTT